MNEITEDNLIYIPDILLPKDADMTAWAVNACDQYTGDIKYWETVRALTDGKLSTYKLIFPEIYLKENPKERIESIKAAMTEYFDAGVFKEIKDGFILVERTTKESGTRTGIVLAVDLESYSFHQEDRALIRSTEATIIDRLPPRVKIRENALIELPHVMLLYDDPDDVVMGAVSRGEVLYDFELSMGGGHVRGTYITNAKEVRDKFYSLVCGDDRMLFAAGDGNHSLAAAKICWEKIKPSLSDEEKRVHPARYALCEAVNIYDKALHFHPIYRFVKTDKPELFLSGWPLTGKGRAQVVVSGKHIETEFPENIPAGIRELDDYIASFIAVYGEEVDYIHGEGDLVSLTDDGAGVLLPSIDKQDFFRLIKEDGNLPRKTFSMGEGNEKRYYIEAKRIK